MTKKIVPSEVSRARQLVADRHARDAALVWAEQAAQSKAVEDRTARLKAARLEKERLEAEAAPPPPPPKKTRAKAK